MLELAHDLLSAAILARGTFLAAAAALATIACGVLPTGLAILARGVFFAATTTYACSILFVTVTIFARSLVFAAVATSVHGFSLLGAVATSTRSGAPFAQAFAAVTMFARGALFAVVANLACGFPIAATVTSARGSSFLVATCAHALSLIHARGNPFTTSITSAFGYSGTAPAAPTTCGLSIVAAIAHSRDHVITADVAASAHGNFIAITRVCAVSTSAALSLPVAI